MSRTLAELIHGLPVSLACGRSDVTVRDVVEDSRHATRGCLFIARSGTKTDGRRFIADAIAAGAVAVLTDDARTVDASIARVQCQDVPLVSSLIVDRFFGNPSRTLKLIGVTGTNGKTTITYLIRHLLANAGIKCGLIGTVQIDDGAHVVPANLTTPPSIELSRAMGDMVKNKCQACVMETSSHALHQKRTAAMQFQIGVFTNLTGDHLDYHQTMDAYLDAKAILFENLPANGFAILNQDDPASAQLAHRTKANILTCSGTDRSADCLAKIDAQTLAYTSGMFSGPWGKFECKLPLIGRHNVMNALQALAVGHAMGLDHHALREGLESCKAPPGRLEPVTSMHDSFAVLVDYAHTDDALENVLQALRPIVPTGGKLRVVFGCGGDRDHTKRPRMARVACKFADDVIITSDNPRTEDPRAIIDEIQKGVPHDRLGDVRTIVDRAQAIEAALESTACGDIVLIAGKGHEDYQIIGTTKRPFDDRLVAAEALTARKASVAVR